MKTNEFSEKCGFFRFYLVIYVDQVNISGIVNSSKRNETKRGEREMKKQLVKPAKRLSVIQSEIDIFTVYSAEYETLLDQFSDLHDLIGCEFGSLVCRKYKINF